MIKIKDKNLQKIILITSFILVNLIIIYGIGSVLSFFNKGANRAEILYLETEPIDVYLPKVNWIIPKNIEYKIDSNVLKKIEKHYLYSIVSKNKAMKSNSINYLKDFYTENKLIEFEKIINFNKKNKISIESTTLEHHLSLNYYSEDGTLVVFTDEKVIEYTNYKKENNFIFSTQDTVGYKNIMLLEDGFWKIRQSKKLKYNKIIRDTIIEKPSIYTIKKN
ncbi:MAG: glycosyl hydrolase family 5, partial [Flavobacterium sp.]